MKKHLFAFAFLMSLFLNSRAQLSFTLTNQTGSYSLTCTNTVISLFVSANTTNSIQCAWFSSTSNSVTGNPQTFTATGNYTVVVKDVVTNSVSTQQFSIFQNTASPTTTVNPVSQIINCSSNTSATFTGTAINPSNNIVQNWYSASYPNGPVSSSSNFSLSLYNIMMPGTHTLEVCDLLNGCCTTKTVSVTSISGNPTFNSSSTTNYILGCAPQNQSTLCISNASTSSGPAQYAFLPPGSFSSVPLPNSAFGPQSCTTTTAPGTWTLVVMDVANSCQSALPVILNLNTVAPNVSAALNTRTITCFTPTITATGSSSTSNTQISWLVPATPSVITNSTIMIGAPNGPSTSPTATTYANYTVVATNTLNSCKTSSIIIINQNFRAPTPLLALGNPSVITCTDTVVIISYTNNAANSGVQGAIGLVDSWTLPGQISSTVTSSSFYATTPGPYTITVHDSYNGCVGKKTILVNSNTGGCVGIEKNSISKFPVKIFPNPSSGNLTIQADQPMTDLKLEILDAQGKLVFSKFLNESSTQLKMDIEKGLYIYRLLEKGIVVKRNKLVIE